MNMESPITVYRAFIILTLKSKESVLVLSSQTVGQQ